MSDTQNQSEMLNSSSETTDKKKKTARKSYSHTDEMRFYTDFMDSKLSVDAFCNKEDTPSVGTMRKIIKKLSPECPNCKDYKSRILELESELKGLRSSMGAQAAMYSASKN